MEAVGESAVTTQMIKEKAASNLEYVISQHLNLITETHAHNFEHRAHYRYE